MNKNFRSKPSKAQKNQCYPKTMLLAFRGHQSLQSPQKIYFPNNLNIQHMNRYHQAPKKTKLNPNKNLSQREKLPIRSLNRSNTLATAIPEDVETITADAFDEDFNVVRAVFVLIAQI